MPQRFVLLFLLVVVGATIAFAERPKVDEPIKVDDRLASLPAAAPAPADNPTTVAKVALGKQLFFDPRLSGGNTLSCSSCHQPHKAFGDSIDWNKGETGITMVRNTQSCLNVGFHTSFFWDGRAATLEEQATGPITSPVEMNQNLDELERELNAVPGYVASFQAAFGAKPDRKNIAQALAAYQRSLVTGPSAFDRYLAGDKHALSDDAKRGLALFTGEARCIECHSGPNLTNGKFYRMGISEEDLGRASFTGKTDDRYKFRTPSLRNVADTAPYMHHGLMHSLEQVVTHYYRGTSRTSTDGLPNEAPNLEERSLDEVPYLIAFLESLSGTMPDFTPPELPPGPKANVAPKPPTSKSAAAKRN